MKLYDVIVIGGSYAGLSAGLSLGRSMRQVLIIDSGQPCNARTPHSHNLLTRDGFPPNGLNAIAKNEVLQYPTIEWLDGKAISGRKENDLFSIITEQEESYFAKKLIFATGIQDVLPELEGYNECWGTSILHCPYCHGYEYKDQKTGIFLNGTMAYLFAPMISNWSDDVTIYTNGPATFSDEERARLVNNKIRIQEKEVLRFDHEDGKLKSIVFKGLSEEELQVMYAKPAYIQHCPVPLELGCKFNEHDLIEIDLFHKTSIPGVYACGDNTTLGRSLANAIAGGNLAGAMVNKELIEEVF